MAATNSSITQGFCGLRLLLVGSDQNSGQDHNYHHHYMLLKDSHKVTVIGQVSTGLSLILIGNDYDCVLVDADESDIDMVDFIDQVLKNQPQQAVIVMGSSDIERRRIVEEAKKYKSVAFLQKPCGGSIVCNMLQCLCSRKLAVDEGTSNGNQLEKTLLNSSTMNNNISVRNDNIHQGVNLNLEKHGAMSKPAVYVDISSDEDDDHEPLITKTICSGKTVTNDKGKIQMEIKRKQYQAVEDDAHYKKRKEIASSIAWTPAIDPKFKQVMNELDKKKVYSPTVLKQMKAEALKPNRVASHFQNFPLVEGAHNMKKTSFIAPTQNVNNSPIENYACRRFGVPTSSESSNKRPLNLNSSGIYLMHIDNIKETLNEFTPLPLPHQTTNTTNNSSNDVFQQLLRGDLELIFEDLQSGTDQGKEVQLSDFGCVNEIEPLVTMDEEFLQHIFGEEMPPPSVIGPTVESPRTGTYKFPDSFDNVDSCGAGGSTANEVPANFDIFGLPVDPWITGGVDGAEASSKDGLDDTNWESYFDAEGSINIEKANLESATFGPSDGLSPGVPGKVNDIQSLVNSSLPSDGSVIDDNWYMNLIQHDHESSIQNLDEDYDRIIFGSIFGN